MTPADAVNAAIIAAMHEYEPIRYEDTLAILVVLNSTTSVILEQLQEHFSSRGKEG